MKPFRAARIIARFAQFVIPGAIIVSVIDGDMLSTRIWAMVLGFYTAWLMIMDDIEYRRRRQ